MDIDSISKYGGCFSAIIGFVLLTIITSAISGIIIAIPSYFIWDWLRPVFEWPKLDFWQMAGLVILLRLLIPVASSSSSK